MSEITKAIELNRSETTDSSVMIDMPSDQRRYPPTQVSFDIEVWVDGAGSQVGTGGRLVDLSAGGAFLELDHDYPVGRPLRLQFYLATLGTVGCRAVLRRYLQGTGVGVEFLDIDPADRARITAFVEKHQAKLHQGGASRLMTGKVLPFERGQPRPGRSKSPTTET